MPKGKKNQHEWGIVAQSYNPYREYYHCELCGKFHEVTQNEYVKESDIPRDAKQPDSDVPYWKS